MSLAAKQGSNIEIKCRGKKPFSDLQQLTELIKNNFGEEKRIKQTNIKEKIFKGIGVSSGVFIGECFLKESVGLAFSHYKISKDDIKKEIERFNGAVKKSIFELNKLIKSIQSKNSSGNNEMKFILEAHVLMLRSSSLVNDARKNIEKKLINAEWSIVDEHRKHEEQYKKIKDSYFRERFDDVKDVCKRIINNLKVDKLAKKINGEIINADSMQVFKEFSILSSRPSSSQTKKIKHHLYGMISARKYFSSGDWLKQAKKKINK